MAEQIKKVKENNITDNISIDNLTDNEVIELIKIAHKKIGNIIKDDVVICNPQSLTLEQIKIALKIFNSLLWTDDKKKALSIKMQRIWTPEKKEAMRIAMKSAFKDK